MLKKTLIKCFLLIGALFISDLAYGQFLFGPKIGVSYYTTQYKSDEYLGDPNPSFERIKPGFDLGYQIGGIMTYQVKDNFALHTELLYTKSGKKLVGGKNNPGETEGYFRHKASYHYLEVPFLFRKSYDNAKKTYKFYWNVGGNFKYWLGGKGKIRSAEFMNDHGIAEYDEISYKLKFGYAEEQEDNVIRLAEPNRVQLGLDFGVGFLLNMPHPKHMLMLDLKYQYGHSWFGNDHGIDVGLFEYYEDFRASNHTLTFSVGYILNQDRGEHKKGKSTQDKLRKKAKPKRRR